MSGKDIRETLGFLAVVAGLLFVGLEIRQNARAARGTTMQAISDASSTFMASLALDGEIAALAVRVFEGATSTDFNPVENVRLSLNLFAFVRMLENTYLQHREGMVPDAVFESYGWNDGMLRTAYFAQWWSLIASEVVSPAFREFFESRVPIGL